MKKIIYLLLSLITSLVSAQNNFKVPKFEKFQLPNGLTVYLMEQLQLVPMPEKKVPDYQPHLV